MEHEPSQSGAGHGPKLRAACDRCHELKNRCARAGDPDSRCERCDRLDIDCVYNASARMGRPTTQKPGSWNRPKMGTRSAKYWTHKQRMSRSQQAQQAQRQQCPSPGPSSMLPPGEAGGGPAGPVGDLDNNEPDRTEGNAFSPPGMDSPLSMLPSDFLMDSSCLESIPVGHEPDINMLPVDPVHLPDCHWFMDDAHIYPAHEVKTASVSSLDQDMFRLTEPDTEDPVAAPRGDELSRLQTELQHIVLGIQSSPMDQPWHASEDVVLDKTKTFLEIAQTFMKRSSTEPGDTHLTLQILTCYVYVWQLIEPLVSPPDGRDMTSSSETISGQDQQQQQQGDMDPGAPPTPFSSSAGSSNPVTSASIHGNTTRSTTPWRGFPGAATAFSLGRFNLASQPDLNKELVLHTIWRMIQKIRRIIRHLGRLALRGGVGMDLELELEMESGGGEAQAGHLRGCQQSPLIMAATAMLDVVQKKERDLEKRLEDMANIF